MGLGKALGTGAVLDRWKVTSIEKQRPVEVAFVLDRSGSMEAHRKAAITGYNQFVADQQAQSGEAVMSLRQFGDECTTTFDGVAVRDVKALNRKTFAPEGSTALFDAVGRTIAEVMTRQAALPKAERPARTLVAILTDGEENASREYSPFTVREMVVRAREVFGWEFILIGVGVDAQSIAQDLGIDERKALTTAATSAGMFDAMRTVSGVTSAFRETGAVPLLTGPKGH